MKKISHKTREKLRLSHLGKKFSQETKDKMSIARLGKKMPPFSKQHRKRMSEAKLKNPTKYWLGKKRSIETNKKISCSKIGRFTGENSHKWIKDRTKIKTYDDRRTDSLYIIWRKELYKRDSGKCKINDLYCSGRLEAHHIFDWKNYKELRYVVDNGIILCKFHHPKTRKEEDRLRPFLLSLIKKTNGK